MLSRSFWCLIEEVFGVSLTSVTTSDMSVEVEVARMLALFGAIDVFEPHGVLRGDSASSLLFVS